MSRTSVLALHDLNGCWLRRSGKAQHTTLAEGKWMMRSEDVVVLDGPFGAKTWPLEEAEALLADQTPWGLAGPHENGPRQTERFCRLAGFVNAYHRPERTYSPWALSVLEDVEAGGSYVKYGTQELLDILFLACRAEHFTYGAIKVEEPRLRALLREVVRRVRSDHPPTFVLPPKAP